jgi:hypothetical protein
MRTQKSKPGLKKAKSLLGAAKAFFDNKDVDKRIKSHIYVVGPLNALLWGCETWNLTKQKLSKLTSFHHSAIRRILAISWKQVREKHIKNKEVRGMLCNIPNIDAFITRRTAVYIGKITRSEGNSLPKKLLAAWIRGPQKNRGLQLSCNNNFAQAIQKILPSDKALTSKKALLKEWIPLARDKNNWQTYIDNYFESCWKSDQHDDNPATESESEEVSSGTTAADSR